MDGWTANEDYYMAQHRGELDPPPQYRVVCACGFISPCSPDFDDIRDVRDAHDAQCAQQCVIQRD